MYVWVQFCVASRVVKVACGGLVHTHLPAASLFQVPSLVFLYARRTDQFTLESLSQCEDTSSAAMVYSTQPWLAGD
jgi:hypothetical protein